MKRFFFLLVIALVTSGLLFYWPTVESLIARTTPNQTTSLLFVGDIMLSRHIGELSEVHGPDFPFVLIATTTKAADITFANLENPVSSRGKNVGSIYSFRASPRVLSGLKQAGFDVVSLANNHIWDYSEEAFLDTLTHLSEHKINFIGVGKNYDEAHQPVIISKNGVRVAYFAYTDLTLPFLIKPNSAPAVAFPDLAVIKRSIGEIISEKRADIIVISFHWGNEYETVPEENQTSFAHSIIDAGAHIVVGHHPHVVQPIERYKNGVIAYSLGNFIFDQNFSPDTGRGLMLKIEVNREGIVSVEELSIRFNEQFQPFL